MCGGNDIEGSPRTPEDGLSPRVRGKLLVRQAQPDLMRSIPACAGETRYASIAGAHEGVYPRVCGGNSEGFFAQFRRGGLSPRVRGKRANVNNLLGIVGSIPACAGETVAAAPASPPAAVYPRVCGGNTNPPTPPPEIAVYPRVCGGNSVLTSAACSATGLSPRVRGKREVGGGEIPRCGSIPACAGETGECPGWHCGSGVYPRVCGGNRRAGVVCLPPAGLSPRVRGKQAQWVARKYQMWSIPACAGETHRRRDGEKFSGVYPRVCGGNSMGPPIQASLMGLSPRVRGKRNAGDTPPVALRSIPACAGETRHRIAECPGNEVYPRVCGGNSTMVRVRANRSGLSPRVRGKRYHPP